MERVRVRFAPSPTGPLHIGGARSALFNYLLAKKQGGDFIVRVEDTDKERSERSYEQDILDSLRWLGLDWDEGPDKGGEYGPYRQMERLHLYERYIKTLFDQGLIYHCFCTGEELEKERQDLLKQGKMPRYMGKCSDLTSEECEKLKAEGRKPTARFRVPKGITVTVNDMVRGKVDFDSDGLGDFVVFKSDGIPTYNFAVVVDDYEMNISHVIRADEHLSNTPRQLLLYQALGIEPPEFAHISLILGKDRSKMSKRHGATSINQYYGQGYLPEALVNFLVLLGWSPEGEDEIYTLDEIIERFSLDRVSKSPAVFDIEKLRWLNGVYIRRADVDRIAQMALPYLQEKGYVGTEPDDAEYDKMKSIVHVVRDYLSSVSEITDYVGMLFDREVDFENQEAVDVLREEHSPELLRVLIEKIEAEEGDSISPEAAKKIMKSAGKELGIRGRKVFMPIRVALTGKIQGPELHEMISVFGKKETLNRIKASLEKVSD